MSRQSAEGVSPGKYSGFFSSTVDALAWLTTGSVLFLFLGTSCEVIPDAPSSDATCSADDAGVSDSDDDPEPDTDVACAANDSEATASITGTTHGTETIANGSDSNTTASTVQTVCYQVDAAGNLSVFMTITTQRFEKFCPGREGVSEVATKVTIRREGFAPLVVYDAAASIGCDDGDVTNNGFPPCTETIADTRFLCAGSEFITDVLQLNAGDKFAVDLEVSSQSHLPVDAVDGDVTEARVSAVYSLSASFLNIVPCTSATSCATNGDCSGGGELCLDANCRVPTFGANLGPVFTIDPDPVSPGQAFGMRVTLNATEGELMPIRIVGSVSDTALAVNGTLTAGQVGGACVFDSAQRFLIATSTPNELFLDVDQSATFDTGEPILTYGEDGGGAFLFEIDIPPNGLRTTVAADAEILCSLNSLFLAGAEGSYPIQVDATSVDPDTGGVDDGAGVDPLTFSSSDQVLVIGEGGSSASCGDPVPFTAGSAAAAVEANAVSASDALFVLRAAVGLDTCQLCVCDVDDNGSASATDALAVLRASVGLPVTLTCPAC